LPDVRPCRIVAARHIKKHLSGDLSKTMRTYPRFPGNEANYLRAQIARVASATAIAPKGLFQEKAPEEEQPTPAIPDLERSAEFEGIALKDPLNLDDFVHMYPHIREFGRCTKYKPPKKPKKKEDDDEEEEEAEEEPEAEDNPDVVALLRELSKDTPLVNPDGEAKKKKKAVSEDGEEPAEDEPAEEDEEAEGDTESAGKNAAIRPRPLQKKQPAWTARMYNTLNKPHAVAILKSHRWPGAYAFVAEKGKKSGFVYIGNGLKSQGGLGFTPMLPPMPLADPKKPNEALDPSRLNEKRILNNEEPVDETKDENDPGEEEAEDE
jgi:radial spoke head protein 4/6